jgi:hypothetical protein
MYFNNLLYRGTKLEEQSPILNEEKTALAENRILYFFGSITEL